MKEGREGGREEGRKEGREEGRKGEKKKERKFTECSPGAWGPGIVHYLVEPLQLPYKVEIRVIVPILHLGNLKSQKC